MTPAVIGVDPGGRSTGVVARQGDALLWHGTVEADLTVALLHYLDAVHAAVEEALGRAMVASDEPFPLIGVEGVVAPGGFKHGKREPINVSGIIGAASVLGAVIGTHCTPADRIVIVPPSGHGTNRPLRLSYPAALIGDREGEAGTGQLRHCRSAWDVAGTAPKIAELLRRASARSA